MVLLLILPTTADRDSVDTSSDWIAKSAAPQGELILADSSSSSNGEKGAIDWSSEGTLKNLLNRRGRRLNNRQQHPEPLCSTWQTPLDKPAAPAPSTAGFEA